MSHTPGPLHVGFHWRGHGYGDFAVMTESGAIVAEIKSGLRDDAQLYAGAPALLEAREAAAALLPLACTCQDGTIGSGVCAACKATNRARAAIAKTKEATA